MNGFIIPGIGGLTAIEAVLKTQADTQEFKNFLEKAQDGYDRDKEFKAEIDRILAKGESVVDHPEPENDPAFEGLTDSERDLVLASMRRADDPTVQLSGASQNNNTTKLVVVGLTLAAAALIALFVFRGVVFRTLYALAVRLPLVGGLIRTKYGEPKEILSGKLSEDNLNTLISKISALERLTGIRGSTNGESNLVLFLKLVRELPIPDVERIYRDAQDYKRIR